MRGDCPACGARALRRCVDTDGCRCVVCSTTFESQKNRVSRILAACVAAAALAMIFTVVLGVIVPPTPVLMLVSFGLLFVVFLTISIIAVRRLARGIVYLRSLPE